jgi:hypothetical protein
MVTGKLARHEGAARIRGIDTQERRWKSRDRTPHGTDCGLERSHNISEPDALRGQPVNIRSRVIAIAITADLPSRGRRR